MSVRVWAPRARSVALAHAAGRTPLREAGRGWWQAEVSLQHGEDYGFVLDGAGPFPDPRSPWQPEGVHGPSRWVDHARFAWSDAGWQPPPLGAGPVYELHVGSFTPQGSFDGVVSRLDHLQSLGVTHVELMPVAAFPGARGWGYDGVDLYAPHAAYGGPEGLKRLVDACHARGLAVLLDVVYNHLGPDGNYLARFGPYFTRRAHTPWGEAVNLDGAGSDEVRRFFIDNARMWLRDYHIDGLRIDAVHAFTDRSAYPFLEQLTAELHALAQPLGRKLWVIAESSLNDPRLLRPPQAGGLGMDAQWNEDFHHAVHAALTGERAGYYADFGRLADIVQALTHNFVHDGRYSVYRQRRHGRPADDVPASCFVACLQNHDYIGNRAQGDRIGHVLSPARLRIGAALLFAAPFVPMLFQGEEWNASTPFLYFTDHADPQLGAAVRDGRRREFAAFGWDPAAIADPQDASSHRRSVLDWGEPVRAPHAAVLDWYRALIALRRSQPELASGAPVNAYCDEAARWLVCERGAIRLVCNLADLAQRVPWRRAAGGALLLASQDGVAVSPEAVQMPAQSVAFVRVDAAQACAAGANALE